MATLEEIKEEVRAEVELEKPLNKSVDGVISELTDEEYEQLITDRAESRFDVQENGWIEARLNAYGSINDQQICSTGMVSMVQLPGLTTLHK